MTQHLPAIFSDFILEINRKRHNKNVKVVFYPKVRISVLVWE